MPALLLRTPTLLLRTPTLLLRTGVLFFRMPVSLLGKAGLKKEKVFLYFRYKKTFYQYGSMQPFTALLML